MIELININRSQRRKLDKKMKKGLTKDQFQELKNESINETIKLDVDRQVKVIFDKLCVNLIQAMKEHRISEERIEKIIKRATEIGE